MNKKRLTSDQRAELAKKRRAQVQAARNTLNREVSAARAAAGLKYISAAREEAVRRRRFPLKFKGNFDGSPHFGAGAIRSDKTGGEG